MALVLPYAMRDNEPVIMKLGAPMRLLAPKIAAAEAAAADAREISERTLRAFDPWFAVETSQDDAGDGEGDEEEDEHSVLKRKKAVKRRFTKTSIAPAKNETISIGGLLRKQMEDEQRKANAGSTVWVWRKCSGPGPDPSRPGMYPFEGVVLSWQSMGECTVQCGAVISPGVDVKDIENIDPMLRFKTEPKTVEDEPKSAKAGKTAYKRVWRCHDCEGTRNTCVCNEDDE